MKSKIKKPALPLRRSIFRKYLYVILSIILVSVIALGATMLIFVANYWESEKKEVLTENANHVAYVFEAASEYNDFYGIPKFDNPEFFNTTIYTLAESNDMDIFIVDTKGHILTHSEQKNCERNSDTISSDILGNTIEGEFFEFGTLDGFYESTHYTAGVPVVTNEFGISKTVAFCYVSTESSFVSALTMTMMKMFLIAAIITMLLAILIVSILSYRMAKPLRQMSEAAKKFAVGDFSARVKVLSDDEIGELATAFNNMADSLSSSEGMRRSFIANVSHELKTPMTTIAGFIDGMLDGTITPDKQRHYMNIVSLEVKRLSRLVQSMLSLSRIDNGELKLSREDFELFSVIINVLAGFEPKIREKNLDIRGLENFTKLKINADPDLMHQVIYNLIENAVKFTNNDGYIAFSLNETKYELSISIENSGPGIPPEDIRFVFDRFYKTDKSRSMDKKGMGLGLFITRSIMRLHGGHIYVESEPDNFCRFTFQLPLIKTQSEKPNSKYIDTTATIKPEDK